MTRPTTSHHAVPSRACPRCRETLDCAVPADGTTADPKPGDLSLCLYCGTLVAFTDALDLRAVAPDELRRLPVRARREILQYQQSILAWRRRAASLN